jgi:hypothetical protein
VSTRVRAVLFQVSWSYGRLSNEELLLGYGFVPRPRLHADCRAGFALPASVFTRGLDALSAECPAPPDVEASRRQLLSRLGALQVCERRRAVGAARRSANRRSCCSATWADWTLCVFPPQEAGGRDGTMRFSVYLDGEPELHRESHGGASGPDAPLSTIVRAMCVTTAGL